MIRFLLLLSLSMAAAAGPTRWDWCLIGARSVGDIDEAIASIKKGYQSARRRNWKLSLGMEARRLVNTEDWLHASGNALEVYGPKVYSNWSMAARYGSSVAKTAEIGPELLKTLHTIALQDHYFVGHEKRRVERDLAEGKISPEVAAERLSHVNLRDRVVYSGVDQASLAGKFRSDPLDSFVHNGDQKSDQGRWMAGPDLESFRKNPYLKVDEATIRERRPGQFTGDVHFVPPAEVEKAVSEIFAQLNLDLAASKTDRERVVAICRMRRDLMTVHPFLDGNGRAIRLLADLLYERYDLPPPIQFHERDMNMDPVWDLSITLQGMRLHIETLETENRK